LIVWKERPMNLIPIEEFEYLGIDLSGEEAVVIGDGNAITQKYLNQMRRNLNVVGEEDVEDEAGDEGVPHQLDVGLTQQFPPELMGSFSQGMQSFCSAWGENFLNLGSNWTASKLNSHVRMRRFAV
ncbi:hypothetical protein PIB30_081009, partial [Stylosanthes scabra]|nr:hypothetical protein [Stylosanthes scabra]